MSAEDAKLGERRVVPLTLIVLIIAFGALVAAVLPVLIGMLAIMISLGIVTIASQWSPPPDWRAWASDSDQRSGASS